ncbi:RNHCP domain-containing protein [Alkalicella caledoniensis]|uniref:RNHCP domain-containing protein n=1 Tax=Alkalicella caledoniensis TaxID=2731377 RepID=A0A7G9W5V1_ALKCA|nr:RNHCP domain-containing protein [Alkalicella caledoniensis]QNO14063.1 RNHCP domain-containing protein [Alkalicella caledoniensis]
MLVRLTYTYQWKVKKHPKKGYQIIHRCMGCGEEKVNIIAEDTLQGDSMDAILKLASL